jgi:imidazolonepropionase-like amidohydrolase
MKRHFISLLITLAPILGVAQNVLVIKNVSVVDVKAGKVIGNTTVIIEDHRIKSVGIKLPMPKNAITIDGKGKYVIPGLWDMHVHMLIDGYTQFLPLFVANGVTGVRDMGGTLSFEKIREVKDSIQNGELTGPRIVMTGRLLDGPGNTSWVGVAIHTPEEGREAVKDHKKAGADFIKVYNLLSKESYIAIMDEAKKQGIPVVGHVPFSVTVTEASDLGQVSVEHAAAAASLPADLFLSCSSEEAKLRTQLENDRKAGKETRGVIEDMAAKTYDENKAKALFDRFVKNGTWQCPTTIFNYPYQIGDSAKLATDPRLQYIPEFLLDHWKELYRQRMSMGENVTVRKMRLQKRIELLNMMHKQGVLFLAGTDVANPYVFPGFSLHEELEYMVKAGFTPFEALQTATINPARFLKAADSLGTVEQGKIADLVLLDANPLENISNTKKIYAVIVNGKLLERKDLDELLDKAKQLAAK